MAENKVIGEQILWDTPTIKAKQNLAGIIESFFVGNAEAYALQQKDGSYLAVREPLTTAIIERHIRGDVTVGTYLIPAGSNLCKVAVLDIDSKTPQALERMLWIQKWLRHFGIESLVEPSGNKGSHEWILFKCWVSAIKAQRLLQGALYAAEEKLGKPDYSIEINPKQSSVGESELGNLIKLPWGYHRITGNRTFFVDENGSPLPNDGIDAIEAQPVITEDKLDEILAEIPPSNKGEQSKGTEKRQRESSPCIESILKGVQAGCRDEAAFALARFFASQSFAQRTTLRELERWDAQNNPSLGNKILKDKVKSAYKGRYSFGCSSIKDNALLAHFCQNPDTCAWAKKKDTAEELAFQEFQQAIVGNSQKVSIHINKITGAGDAPSYEVLIDGFVPDETKVLKLSLGQLSSFGSFQQKVCEVLDFFPFSIEHWTGDLDVRKAWLTIVEKLLRGGNFSVVQCPQNMTDEGYTFQCVIGWAENAPNAKDMVDVDYSSHVVHKKKGIYVKAEKAKGMLKRKHNIDIKSSKLWEVFRKRGLNTGSVRVGDKSGTMWLIPDDCLTNKDYHNACVQSEESGDDNATEQRKSLMSFSESDIEAVISSEKKSAKVTASRSDTESDSDEKLNSDDGTIDF